MTEVAFHFGAPDKITYACRLLRKAASGSASVFVLAQRDLCVQLDADLWALGPAEFVPHCQDTAPECIRRHSPIRLSSNPDLTAETSDQVLVQLSPAVPDGFQSFRRVIEIVSTEEGDKALARQRWRTYAAVGLQIQRHDLALKEQS